MAKIFRGNKLKIDNDDGESDDEPILVEFDCQKVLIVYEFLKNYSKETLTEFYNAIVSLNTRESLFLEELWKIDNKVTNDTIQ